MNDGYIKLYKKLLKWQWYKDSNTLHIFITLLLDANYEDSKVGFEVIKRGQCLTSLKRLCELTGLTVKQVRTSLDKLEKSQEIGKQTTNKYSIITIKNYNDYQKEDKQRAIKGQTKGNIKEEQEEKEINSSSYILGDAQTEILNLFQQNGIVYSNTPNEFNIVNYLSKIDLEIVKEALEIAKIKNKIDLNYILGIVLNKLKKQKEFEKNKKPDMELPEWFDKKYEREELSDEERRILEEIESGT